MAHWIEEEFNRRWDVIGADSLLDEKDFIRKSAAISAKLRAMDQKFHLSKKTRTGQKKFTATPRLRDYLYYLLFGHP